MILTQQAGGVTFARTPEPEQVTTQEPNVLEYDRVMSTKLAVDYAAALEIIYRSRCVANGGTAADLCCGPGHYTLCLTRFLSFDVVKGFDLSPGMVEVANRNAADQGLAGHVEFRRGDVTRLKSIGDGAVDLASFTDAAHHMPDLSVVQAVLEEMDRITRPEGLIMVMDLVRLRTKALTQRYVNTLGHDYVERGLPNFFDDFRNSMYAAWTAPELFTAIPTKSRRWWCQLVPRGLPTVQFILGLPVGRRKLFVRSGLPWSKEGNPVPREMRSEWRMLRASLRFASRHWVPPGAE